MYFFVGNRTFNLVFYLSVFSRYHSKKMICRRVFGTLLTPVKKGVLKNLTKPTGKHLCLRPTTLLKRDSGTGVSL